MRFKAFVIATTSCDRDCFVKYSQLYKPHTSWQWCAASVRHWNRPHHGYRRRCLWHFTATVCDISPPQTLTLSGSNINSVSPKISFPDGLVLVINIATRDVKPRPVAQANQCPNRRDCGLPNDIIVMRIRLCSE